MNQDAIVEFLFLVKGTLKYRWVALIIAWIVCVGGWVFISKMPDKYVSEARVHVDTQSMLEPLLKGMTVDSNLDAQVELMRQLMFTQQNLSEIARVADIDTANMGPIERYDFFEELKEEITLSGSRKSPIFFISYTAIDPQYAKDIVNAVLTVFSDKAQKTNYSDVASARRFIDEQIAQYETRLRHAEKAREEFRRINFGLLPEDSTIGVLGKIDRLIQEKESSELSLQETISRRATTEQQLQEALMIGDSAQLPEVETPEDVEIAQLNANKTLLLLKYTQNHPDVIAINQAIKEWENNKEKNKVVQKSDDGGALIMEHPYITELKTILNEEESREASARSRLRVIGERVVKLKEEQSIRLRVETELQGLNRDYDTLTSNYNNLVTRREQVNITKNIDEMAIALKFNIADPPNKPLQPSEPNRILLVSVAYFGGLVLGFGLAFLIYYLRPTFVTTRQISMHTGLAVLGGISFQEEAVVERFNFLSLVYYTFLALLTVLFVIVLGMEIAKSYGYESYGAVIQYIKQYSTTFFHDLL